MIRTLRSNARLECARRLRCLEIDMSSFEFKTVLEVGEWIVEQGFPDEISDAFAGKQPVFVCACMFSRCYIN